MSNKPIRLIVYFLGAFTLLALVVTATQAKYMSALGGASGSQAMETATPTMATIDTLVPSMTPEPSATPTATLEPGITSTPKSKEVHFSGVISAINGDQWTIGSFTVTVSGKTEIEGKPVVGDTVSVEAVLQADGTYLAQDISKESEHQPSITPGANKDDDNDENDDNDEDEQHVVMTGTPIAHHGEDENEGEHHVHSTPNATPSFSGDHEGDGGGHHGGDDGGSGSGGGD